jgi:hypothetical protein
MRPSIAPDRSRSSSARYGAPARVVSRSLRLHAYTPAISPPARSAAIVVSFSAVVATQP